MQESQNPWSALDIRYSSISNPFLLNLLAASHKRDAVLGQITLNQVQITGGKGNKAAIGIVANKDNGTGQIPLASQCDDLTRVVTESHRHIVADREYPIFRCGTEYIDLLLIRAVGIQAGAELEIGSIVRAQLATVRGTVGTFASGDHMVHGVLNMAQSFVSLVAHLASPRFSSGAIRSL